MTQVTNARYPNDASSGDALERTKDSKSVITTRSESEQAGAGYIWLRLLLTAGLLLGLLLLVQSVATYYQVTRTLVVNELRKEAQRYLTAIEREGRRTGIRSPAELGPLLDEILEESSQKVAWVRVTDFNGHVLVSSGNAVDAPFDASRLPRAAEEPASIWQIRREADRQVLVTAFPLRIARRPPPQTDRRDAMREPNQGFSPHFVEMALYLDSASGAFGRLRTNLAVSTAAALGLVASVILLWLRLPQYVRGIQLERQTELARQVQMDLLPAADSVFTGLDFAAVCVPAQQVGGDFYDVFCDGDRRIAIVLGDVSGKGLPASVVVGLLLGAVRASEWMRGGTEHEASSIRLSELLRTRTAPERFASMFWCYYEPESHVLRYINAGHLPPLLVRRADGAGLEVHRLTEGGPVLGLLQSAEYRQGRSTVLPGDMLVLFSDGVVEAMSATGELFDESRLLAVIRENLEKSSTEIREEILKRVLGFLGQEQAQDDLTLVVARFGNNHTGRIVIAALRDPAL